MNGVPHLSLRLVALVALGGAVGSLARYGVSEGLSPIGGWPTATFVVNMVGAFCLGLMLEVLARRGPETVATRRIRLAVGTGFFGGFTTFSSLALEMERLLAGGDGLTGVAYGVVSVAAGFTVAFLGVVVGARRHRVARLPVDPDAVEDST